MSTHRNLLSSYTHDSITQTLLFPIQWDGKTPRLITPTFRLPFINTIERDILYSEDGNSLLLGNKKLLNFKLEDLRNVIGESDGKGAFEELLSRCTNLLYFSLPVLDGITRKMFAGVCTGCTSLNKVEINPALTTVDEYSFDKAFDGCTSLKKFNLPNITTVGAYGFRGAFQNSGLRSLVFPKVTSVSDSSFSYVCYKAGELDEVDFSGITNISSNTSFGNAFNATTYSKYYVTINGVDYEVNEQLKGTSVIRYITIDSVQYNVVDDKVTVGGNTYTIKTKNPFSNLVSVTGNNVFEKCWKNADWGKTFAFESLTTVSGNDNFKQAFVRTKENDNGIYQSLYITTLGFPKLTSYSGTSFNCPCVKNIQLPVLATTNGKFIGNGESYDFNNLTSYSGTPFSGKFGTCQFHSMTSLSGTLLDENTKFDNIIFKKSSEFDIINSSGWKDTINNLDLSNIITIDGKLNDDYEKYKKVCVNNTVYTKDGSEEYDEELPIMLNGWEAVILFNKTDDWDDYKPTIGFTYPVLDTKDADPTSDDWDGDRIIVDYNSVLGEYKDIIKKEFDKIAKAKNFKSLTLEEHWAWYTPVRDDVDIPLTAICEVTVDVVTTFGEEDLDESYSIYKSATDIVSKNYTINIPFGETFKNYYDKDGLLSREGHTLEGWWIKKSEGNWEKFDPDTRITGNITVKPEWKIWEMYYRFIQPKYKIESSGKYYNTYESVPFSYNVKTETDTDKKYIEYNGRKFYVKTDEENPTRNYVTIPEFKSSIDIDVKTVNGQELVEFEYYSCDDGFTYIIRGDDNNRFVMALDGEPRNVGDKIVDEYGIPFGQKYSLVYDEIWTIGVVGGEVPLKFKYNQNLKNVITDANRNKLAWYKADKKFLDSDSPTKWTKADDVKTTIVNSRLSIPQITLKDVCYDDDKKSYEFHSWLSSDISKNSDFEYSGKVKIDTTANKLILGNGLYDIADFDTPWKPIFNQPYKDVYAYFSLTVYDIQFKISGNSYSSEIKKIDDRWVETKDKDGKDELTYVVKDVPFGTYITKIDIPSTDRPSATFSHWNWGGNNKAIRLYGDIIKNITTGNTIELTAEYSSIEYNVTMTDGETNYNALYDYIVRWKPEELFKLENYGSVGINDDTKKVKRIYNTGYYDTNKLMLGWTESGNDHNITNVVNYEEYVGYENIGYNKLPRIELQEAIKTAYTFVAKNRGDVEYSYNNLGNIMFINNLCTKYGYNTKEKLSTLVLALESPNIRLDEFYSAISGFRFTPEESEFKKSFSTMYDGNGVPYNNPEVTAKSLYTGLYEKSVIKPENTGVIKGGSFGVRITNTKVGNTSYYHYNNVVIGDTTVVYALVLDDSGKIVWADTESPEVYVPKDVIYNGTYYYTVPPPNSIDAYDLFGAALNDIKSQIVVVKNGPLSTNNVESTLALEGNKTFIEKYKKCRTNACNVIARYSDFEVPVDENSFQIKFDKLYTYDYLAKNSSIVRDKDSVTFNLYGVAVDAPELVYVITLVDECKSLLGDWVSIGTNIKDAIGAYGVEIKKSGTVEIPNQNYINGELSQQAYDTFTEKLPETSGWQLMYKDFLSNIWNGNSSDKYYVEGGIWHPIVTDIKPDESGTGFTTSDYYWKNNAKVIIDVENNTKVISPTDTEVFLHMLTSTTSDTSATATKPTAKQVVDLYKTSLAKAETEKANLSPEVIKGVVRSEVSRVKGEDKVSIVSPMVDDYRYGWMADEEWKSYRDGTLEYSKRMPCLDLSTYEISNDIPLYAYWGTHSIEEKKFDVTFKSRYTSKTLKNPYVYGQTVELSGITGVSPSLTGVWTRTFDDVSTETKGLTELTVYNTHTLKEKLTTVITISGESKKTVEYNKAIDVKYSIGYAHPTDNAKDKIENVYTYFNAIGTYTNSVFVGYFIQTPSDVKKEVGNLEFSLTNIPRTTDELKGYIDDALKSYWSYTKPQPVNVNNYIGTGGITIYPVWLNVDVKQKHSTYTFTFVDLTTDKIVKTETVERRSKQPEPTSLDSGYLIPEPNTWYYDTAKTYEYDFNDRVRSNVTVYGYVKTNVTFVTQMVGVTVPKQSVTLGSTVTKQEPKKDGYTFDGWYTDKECTTIFDFATPIEKATTLYGKWTETPTTPPSGS